MERGHDVPDADRALRLPAEAGSATRARHHVRRALAGTVPGDVVTDAELCASELVTNAVLHARGAVDLLVAVTGGRVRLEVADSSPVEPQWVPRSLTATTGRGLRLITALSTARGTDVHRDGTGKTVWCELSTTGSAPGAPGEGGGDGVDSLMAAEWASVVADLAPEPAPAGEPPAQGPPVRLLRYPLRRGVRLREHREAVLRELQLLGLADAFPDAPTAELGGDVADLLDAEYGGHLNAAEARKMAALARGLECVDLEYPRRADHLRLVLHWRARLAELQRAARAGLLTAVEPRDVAELARWIVDEFERQLRGGDPSPWAGPLD
ncbi:ATP-binding protein [Kineococcus esterisolvens]|uniref:ATP-binding protein n=1 Tax=unclassified Kineococcus TaxID=2621656 RepID=UPI003D7F17CF